MRGENSLLLDVVMASAVGKGGGLTNSGKRWLVGVSDKLSRHDGLQLLTILYYRDRNMNEGELDSADSVFKIYRHSKDSLDGDNRACVALLHYRLGLLVPDSSVSMSTVASGEDSALDQQRLLEAKDLGAQDCLDFYKECGLSAPAEPAVRQEARLLECLVTAYVNLSPIRRKHLRENLARDLGVYRRKQLDLFNLFCRLLRRDENSADQFIAVLNNAVVPYEVFDRLQSQLDKHRIPHRPISPEEFHTEQETEDDCWTETDLLIKKETKVYHYKLCNRICSKSRVVSLLLVILPLVLFAIAVGVFTSTIDTHDHSHKDGGKFETSSILFDNTLCHTQGPMTAPLIHIGTISNQWYSGFILTQDKPDDYNYAYKNLNIYTILSERVSERSRPFYCSEYDPNVVGLELKGVYFLRGTNMAFNICVHSFDSANDGWLGLAFYDTLANYRSRVCCSGNHSLNYHRFPVGPNQSLCYSYNYTAPLDSFYYILLGTNCQSSSNVTATYYQIDVKMRYANASDWLKFSDKSACNRSDYSSEKECSITLPKTLKSFFWPQTFDIFAQVTSTAEERDFGHLSLTPSFDKKSHILPTIVGLIFFLAPVELTLCILIGLYYGFHRCKSRSHVTSNIVEHDNGYGAIN